MTHWYFLKTPLHPLGFEAGMRPDLQRISEIEAERPEIRHFRTAIFCGSERQRCLGVDFRPANGGEFGRKWPDREVASMCETRVQQRDQRLAATFRWGPNSAQIHITSFAVTASIILAILGEVDSAATRARYGHGSATIHSASTAAVRRPLRAPPGWQIVRGQRQYGGSVRPRSAAIRF